MGNNSYIVQKEHKEDLTKEFIVKYLSGFDKIQVELHKTGQIIVTQDEKTICEMWIEKECYLLNENEVDEENDNKYNEYNKKFKELNISIDTICLGVSYGCSGEKFYKLRSQVITYLLEYFKGYWLDEGIHPEFISYGDECLEKYKL